MAIKYNTTAKERAVRKAIMDDLSAWDGDGDEQAVVSAIVNKRRPRGYVVKVDLVHDGGLYVDVRKEDSK